MQMCYLAMQTAATTTTTITHTHAHAKTTCAAPYLVYECLQCHSGCVGNQHHLGTSTHKTGRVGWGACSRHQHLGVVGKLWFHTYMPGSYCGQLPLVAQHTNHTHPTFA